MSILSLGVSTGCSVAWGHVLCYVMGILSGVSWRTVLYFGVV